MYDIPQPFLEGTLIKEFAIAQGTLRQAPGEDVPESPCRNIGDCLEE